MHIFSNAESYSVLLAWIVMPLGIYVVYRAFVSSEFVAQTEENLAPRREEVRELLPVEQEQVVFQAVEEAAPPEPELPEESVAVASSPDEVEVAETEVEVGEPELGASESVEEEGELGETATDKALREMIAEDRVGELEKHGASAFSENIAEDTSEGDREFTLSEEMNGKEELDDLNLTTESRGPDSGPIEPMITSHDEDEGFTLSASSHGGSVEPPSYGDEEIVEADLPEEESDGELSQDEIDMLLRKEG